ncbi:MAG: hypothetical protein ACI8T1_004192 [Verrucomicrobiales bacterium]|jgi:hypothetical protein
MRKPCPQAPAANPLARATVRPQGSRLAEHPRADPAARPRHQTPASLARAAEPPRLQTPETRPLLAPTMNLVPAPEAEPPRFQNLEAPPQAQETNPRLAPLQILVAPSADLAVNNPRLARQQRIPPFPSLERVATLFRSISSRL